MNGFVGAPRSGTCLWITLCCLILTTYIGWPKIATVGKITSISEVETAGIVHLGCIVTVLFDTGANLTVMIKSPQETDPEHGIISYESPLGKALLKTREGDVVEYHVGEKVMSARVINIIETQTDATRIY